MPRYKDRTPLEVEILAIAHERAIASDRQFHGYEVLKLLSRRLGREVKVGHAGIYKALDRLEHAGFLASAWEATDAPRREGRPPRRIYWLTGTGAGARRVESVPAAPEGASSPTRPVPVLERTGGGG